MKEMKEVFNVFVFLFLFLISVSCGKDSALMPEFPEDNKDEELPIDQKPVMLWVDCSANFSLFVSQDSIVKYIAQAKESGFTDLVVDVRPTSGEVMYKSKIAPVITNWKNVSRDDWDYLAFFIQECHKQNLRIYAAMNTMTGGQNIMRRGPVYTDSKIASWTSLLNTPSGMVDGKNDSRGAVFLNPCNAEVQDYVLSIVKEIVTNYDVDGLMFDRCRYDNETADFTEDSRLAFAQYIKDNYGYGSTFNFPAAILSYDNQGKIVYGDYRKLWYEWRASVIHDFFYKAKAAIKAIKPNMKFATYTGAWYSSYYQEGSNWASKNYNAYGEFPTWATSNYKNTGFAEALDYHLAGVYYATLEGAGWWTIAGGISNVKRVNMGACPVIASLAPEKFTGSNRADFQKAINISMKNADGMMVFDFYHVREFNFWKEIKNALEEANK